MDSERVVGIATKRLAAAAGILGIVTTLAVLIAFTWAILFIHHDRAALRRVPAQIIKVHLKPSGSPTTRMHFGTFSLDVQYSTSRGTVHDTIEHRTYGFPSAGDRITLLIDPRTGHVESNPFPELWILLALIYAAFGALILFFWRGLRASHRWIVRRGR